MIRYKCERIKRHALVTKITNNTSLVFQSTIHGYIMCEWFKKEQKNNGFKNNSVSPLRGICHITRRRFNDRHVFFLSKS